VDSDSEPESAENTEGDTVVVEKSDIAATEVADAPEIAPEAVTAPSGRRWGLILAIVGTTVALLCTAALVVLSLIMLGRNGAVSEEQKLNAEYAAAGRQSVVTLMSLDFNKAQENVQQIIDNSTGQFKTDFENQADDFVKVAQDSKVVTDVSVTAAAVDSMNQDSAVVLVAATSRVTNAAGAKQEPRAWRLSVNLKREGGQIKMEKVEFVP
jgi:Mce-associated membrane protein